MTRSRFNRRGRRTESGFLGGMFNKIGGYGKAYLAAAALFYGAFFTTQMRISFLEALCAPIDIPLRFATRGNVHICNYDFERGTHEPVPAPEIPPPTTPPPEPKKEKKPRHGTELTDELVQAKGLQQQISKQLARLAVEHNDHEGEKLASLYALSRFTTQPSNLPPTASFKSIDDHLIQVKRKDGECGGLLITEDGWFLTAAHCLDPKSVGDQRIVHKELEYRLNGSLYYYPYLDLAIGKADVPGHHKPVQVNLFDSGKIEKNQAVRIFGFRDGLTYRQVGRVTNTTQEVLKEDKGVKIPVFEFFGTNAEATPGYSGGVTMDHITGGLMGVNTNYTNQSTAVDTNGVGPLISAKINGVLMLINGAIKLELGKYEKPR